MSGGRFTVTFNGSTSTPLITQLNGTVFAVGESHVNVAPAIASVTGPTGPLPVDTSTSITVGFTDADVADSHTVRFAWDDGTPDTVLSASSPGATANHTYGDPGVYTVTVTVSDVEGAEATSKFEDVVVR